MKRAASASSKRIGVGTSAVGGWAWHRRALLGLRRRLVADHRTRTTEVAAPLEGFSCHPADAATDEFDHDLALGLLCSEEDALQEIDAALHRIEAGTYGVCEATRRPIPAARLRAIPWARYTVAVQAAMEARGRAAVRRIGGLRSVEGSGVARIDGLPEDPEVAADESLAEHSPGRTAKARRGNAKGAF
ncbi:MAG TPA: transcriptional regulator [Verrucomicrobiales bacterium]|nr:transcriptional regulator [Verrucomicrobiales bacterium]